MTRIHRRDFLKGCCVTAVAAGASSRARAYFAPPPLLPASATSDTLVIVFLRGAMDGLSLLPPGAASPYRADYEINRNRLNFSNGIYNGTRIPASNDTSVATAARGLALANTQWELHPRATHLRDLYNGGNAAFVVAAGQLQPNPVVRSHFQAQWNLEFGVGGGSGGGTGWLTRHLVSGGLPADVPVPAISMGSFTEVSLLGSTDAITMYSGSDFRLDTFHWSWQNDDPAHGVAGAVSQMNSLWGGASTQLELAGADALASLALLRPIDFDLYDAVDNPQGYQPSGGADYNLQYNGSFGSQLRNVAQMIKLNVGVRAVTIDLGNWDTHVGQGNPTQGYDWFGNQVQSLSDGLGAFHTDLASDPAGNLMRNVSVIVVSEFGRRVLENSDSGTDHGYGSTILVLGGAVNGATVYGSYPGLANNQLFEGNDVGVTTDYRQVISEALIRRMGNPNIYYAFPGYADYSPIGIFQGSDLPPTDFDRVFKSGFEGT